MSVLPIGLRAEGLTVLVVGGGRVATRKAFAFLDAGARVRVIALRFEDELRAYAGSLLERVQREFADSDVDEADVAIAATSDPGVNERVVAAARARRRLVNRADDPASGTFDTLAVHRAGLLAIGVSAGGVPRAAACIRDVLAHRFDQRYGDAIESLGRLRSELLPTGRWALAADTLLDGDFCAKVESGEVQRRMKEWS